MDQPETPSKTQSLDEVLVAMDVVDTLRHRDQIFLREIDTKAREEELVDRLKDIYAAQGMEVPESVIRDGVRAMADKRYEHTPAKRGFFRRLAIIYVTRDRWWKPAAVAAAVGVAGLGTYQFGVAMPRAAQERQIVRELNEILPNSLEAAIVAANNAVDGDDQALAQIAALERDVNLALADEDREAAKAGIQRLTELRQDIEATYQVRVVSRPDEFSGVFRVPDDVPGGRNHYLIVEAIDATGRALDVTITDEETQTSKRVNIWGQRVSRTVFERISADKADDQIIQDAIIGEKPAGRLSPLYSVSTPGGAITEW
ncbi:MAG: DUF6384 family protein [Pseudomonadota bacterium]